MFLVLHRGNKCPLDKLIQPIICYGGAGAGGVPRAAVAVRAGQRGPEARGQRGPEARGNTH